MFVINEFVMSCCGRPRTECACRPVHNQPQGLPEVVYNYDEWADAAMYTRDDAHKSKQVQQPVANNDRPAPMSSVYQFDWDAMAEAVVRR